MRVIVAPAECVTLLNEVFYLLRNKCNAIKQRTWNKTLTRKSKFEYGKKKNNQAAELVSQWPSPTNVKIGLWMYMPEHG